MDLGRTNKIPHLSANRGNVLSAISQAQALAVKPVKEKLAIINNYNPQSNTIEIDGLTIYKSPHIELSRELTLREQKQLHKDTKSLLTTYNKQLKKARKYYLLFQSFPNAIMFLGCILFGVAVVCVITGLISNEWIIAYKDVTTADDTKPVSSSNNIPKQPDTLLGRDSYTIILLVINVVIGVSGCICLFLRLLGREYAGIKYKYYYIMSTFILAGLSTAVVTVFRRQNNIDSYRLASGDVRLGAAYEYTASSTGYALLGGLLFIVHMIFHKVMRVKRIRLTEKLYKQYEHNKYLLAKKYNIIYHSPGLLLKRKFESHHSTIGKIMKYIRMLFEYNSYPDKLNKATQKALEKYAVHYLHELLIYSPGYKEDIKLFRHQDCMPLDRIKLLLSMAASVLLINVSAIIFIAIEGENSMSLTESIEFAVITAVTIGYGDLTCKTIGGRIFLVIFFVFAAVTLGYTINSLWQQVMVNVDKYITTCIRFTNRRKTKKQQQKLEKDQTKSKQNLKTTQVKSDETNINSKDNNVKPTLNKNQSKPQIELQTNTLNKENNSSNNNTADTATNSNINRLAINTDNNEELSKSVQINFFEEPEDEHTATIHDNNNDNHNNNKPNNNKNNVTSPSIFSSIRIPSIFSPNKPLDNATNPNPSTEKPAEPTNNKDEKKPTQPQQKKSAELTAAEKAAREASHLAKIKLFCVVLIVSGLLLISPVYFIQYESWTYWEAVYFCFVTFTSIGYGDFYPTKPETRVFIVYLVLFGIGALTYVLSVLSDMVTKRVELNVQRKQAKKKALLQAKKDELQKQTGSKDPDHKELSTNKQRATTIPTDEGAVATKFFGLSVKPENKSHPVEDFTVNDATALIGLTSEFVRDANQLRDITNELFNYINDFNNNNNNNDNNNQPSCNEKPSVKSEELNAYQLKFQSLNEFIHIHYQQIERKLEAFANLSNLDNINKVVENDNTSPSFGKGKSLSRMHSSSNKYGYTATLFGSHQSVVPLARSPALNIARRSISIAFDINQLDLQRAKSASIVDEHTNNNDNNHDYDNVRPVNTRTQTLGKIVKNRNLLEDIPSHSNQQLNPAIVNLDDDHHNLNHKEGDEKHIIDPHENRDHDSVVLQSFDADDEDAHIIADDDEDDIDNDEEEDSKDNDENETDKKKDKKTKGDDSDSEDELGEILLTEQEHKEKQFEAYLKLIKPLATSDRPICWCSEGWKIFQHPHITLEICNTNHGRAMLAKRKEAELRIKNLSENIKRLDNIQKKLEHESV